MSYEYDRYLQQHKDDVRKAFEWIQRNLPTILSGQPDASWQIIFDHDSSKSNDDEYVAYDAYFYGNNRSYAVVEEFRMAWLRHIHRNPHHWQYWVLINDDPSEGEIILDMPYNYIVEMICDWWSFSWQKGDLGEIFGWYYEHSDYIKLSSKTRATVESILEQMQERLGLNKLEHHGIKGQKWGVKNGPPYPLDKNKDPSIIEDIYIGKSLGAKGKNYDVLDPESGERFHFSEGTYIRDIKVFAGKGGVKPLDVNVADGLADQMGGKAEEWQHCKGIGTIDYYGEDVDAEVHWFQEPSVGKCKFKIKNWRY